MKAITIQNNLSPKLHQKKCDLAKTKRFWRTRHKKGNTHLQINKFIKKITKLNIVISAQENLRKNTKQHFKYF